MPGSTSSFLARSSVVTEVTPGTTPATPAFKTMHAPAIFTGESERLKGRSLTAGGSNFGDALKRKPSLGKVQGPMITSIYDTLWESLLQNSFTTNVCTDGKLRQTNTYELSFPAGEAGTTTYVRNLGVEAVGAKVTVSATGTIDVEFDLVGMQSDDATTTAITGATYTAPTAKEPLSAEGDIGVVTLSGITLPNITNMTIDYIYDGREPQPKIGSNTLVGVTRGAFIPKITLKCYLESSFLAIFNASRISVATERVFTWNFGSVSGAKYSQVFHSCIIDMAPADLSQPTGFQTLTITPSFSVANGCVMTMTRQIV